MGLFNKVKEHATTVVSKVNETVEKISESEKFEEINNMVKSTVKNTYEKLTNEKETWNSENFILFRKIVEDELKAKYYYDPLNFSNFWEKIKIKYQSSKE